MPELAKKLVQASAGGLKPEAKKRGRKPKTTDEEQGGQTKKKANATAKAKAKAKAKATAKATAKAKAKAKAKATAKAKAKAKAKCVEKKSGTKKPTKVQSKDVPPRRKRRVLPKMSDEEKRALRSRLSSAYHNTRKQCLLDGLDPEEAKSEARKVS